MSSDRPRDPKNNSQDVVESQKPQLNQQLFNQETIDKIAKLSRLAVSDQQALAFSQQLAQALKHFEEISTVETGGIEPLITPTQIENWTREDVVDRGLSVEDMMANAPERVGNLFKVPPVV